MPTTPAPTRRAAAAALAGLLALAAAGCSATSAADGPQELDVALVDYAFDGLPDELAAGSALTVSNTSETELHELVAVRLPDDEDRAAAELVALPPDELGALFAGVTDVLLQAPGSDDVVAAVGDGVLDQPGRYLVVCMIPTGADPATYLEAAATSDGPPQVPGGPPHVVAGMFDEVVVTG